MGVPFTWGKLESMHGPIGEAEKRRIRAVVKDPAAKTWERARSIVIAGGLGMRCSTLWQCVEAVTLQRYPSDRVPGSRTIVCALCYATGEPFPK